MSWTAYKVVLRLLTPLHVGAGQLGNVQRTRPYVTGKALWGALTARLTRDDLALAGDYVAVGRCVDEELAFSYFYPAVGEEVDLWPWSDPDEFAWRYLGSHAGTALDYDRNTAEEGSLHETEFIAATARGGRSVHLVGYIFEQAGCSLPWRAAVSRLQVGGERTCGWGRVEPKAVELVAEPLFGLYRMSLDGERPLLHLHEGSRLLAHTLAVGEGAVAAEGRLAPLVGRETREADRHGQRVSAAGVYWEPGAVTKGALSVQIGHHGLWHSV
jgi:hypothetical protein